MLEDFIRHHCQPPTFHTSIYIKDGESFTQEDWRDYRNPAFRHRPQPILTFGVAVGFWPHLLLVVIISFALMGYHHYLEPLGAPSINTGVAASGILTMATFFVSLLLVFKLNNAYARWWEARTQWGAALAMLRNYLAVMNSWVNNDNSRAVASKAARWVPAVMYMLKAHLRAGGDPIEAVKDLLTEDECRYLSTCSNKPLAGGHVLHQLAVELGVHPIIISQLQGIVSNFLLQHAGAERILKTPLPLSYHRFTSRACMLYILAVPIMILPLADWLTPLVAFIIAFMLLGVEHISAQIEEPFRVLDLDAICNSVHSASEEPWAQSRGLYNGAIRIELQSILAEPEMQK